MKRKTSNSPYPILYPAGEEYAKEQGYRQAHFDVAGEPNIHINKNGNLVIDFDVELTDTTLENLVSTGTAKYYVNIECGRTYLRRAYVQAKENFHIEINHGDIAETVEIFIGLVADHDVHDFSAPGFLPQYGSAKFDIEKGDILAVGTGWTADLKEKDGTADMPIRVNKDPCEKHSELWVNGMGDTLIINLAKDLYDVYFTQKKSRKPEFIALVMKPAILFALQSEIIRARNEGEEDARTVVKKHRWLRKLDELIERLLAEENIDWDINNVKIDEGRDSDTLVYAIDVLLKRPLAKAFEEINKKTGDGNDES